MPPGAAALSDSPIAVLKWRAFPTTLLRRASGRLPTRTSIRADLRYLVFRSLWRKAEAVTRTPPILREQITPISSHSSDRVTQYTIHGTAPPAAQFVEHRRETR